MSAVRKISVDFDAGTTKFYAQVDGAARKLREFGRSGASSAQGTAAAMHILEGNFAGTQRTVDKFIETVLGLGPALQKAFIITGAVAFAGVLVDIGKKVYDFWKTMNEAPAKSTIAFRELSQGVRATNDELAVTNARLENEIAKLEGRHENTLKLALLQTKKASDDLSMSLDEALKKAQEVLKERDVSILALGTAGTSDLPDMAGRFRAEQADLAIETPTAQLPEASAAMLRRQIRDIQASIHDAQVKQDQFVAEHAPITDVTAAAPVLPGEGIQDQTERLKGLRFLQKDYQDQLERNQLTQDQMVLKPKLEGLKAAGDADDRDPFGKNLREQLARIKGLQTELDAAGKNEAGRLLAKSFAEADKEIEKVNEQLKKLGLPQIKPGGQREAVEQSLSATKVSTEAELAWQNKYREGTVQITDRIHSLDLLTAALGRGYETTRDANVQTQLMVEYGEHYGDKEWMAQINPASGKTNQSEFDARQTLLTTAADKETGHQTGAALVELNKQIQLERELAAVQQQGAEALRQVTLAAKLREMQLHMTAAEFQTAAAAEIALYNAERSNAAAGALAGLQQKMEATQRLTMAILQGRDAVRAANLENEIAANARQYSEPVAAAVRQFGILPAEQTAHAEDVAKTAAATPTQSLTDRIQQLQEALEISKDQVGIEIQLRDLENQRLQAITQEYLGLRDARDGVRAFFTEMQTDAEAASKIIYDAMNSALDRSSQNLAKLFTGQKTDWAKQFKQEGTEMVAASTKSLLHTGLGALGGLIGIHPPAGKPQGTALDPIWVRMAGAGLGGVMTGPTPSAAELGRDISPAGSFGAIQPSSPAGQPGFFGSLLKVLGFGGGGDSSSGGPGTPDVSSSISYPGMAAGGDIEPEQPYMVGEHGPELRRFATGGSIVPNDQLGGGGGVHFHFGDIDARGADIGVEARIQRAMAAVHDSAVPMAVRAMTERSKRVPRG
jgi:hypothetical protein